MCVQHRGCWVPCRQLVFELKEVSFCIACAIFHTSTPQLAPQRSFTAHVDLCLPMQQGVRWPLDQLHSHMIGAQCRRWQICEAPSDSVEGSLEAQDCHSRPLVLMGLSVVLGDELHAFNPLWQKRGRGKSSSSIVSVQVAAGVVWCVTTRRLTRIQPNELE